MYETNIMWSMTDRSRYEEDRATTRHWYGSNGATDVMLFDLLSGVNAGAFVTSARFETLDSYTDFMETSIAQSTNTTTKEGEVRTRYQLVARNVQRVFNESGERTGPYLSVSLFSSEKPLPADENKYSMDLLVANG